MTGNELRKKYIEFFKNRGHIQIPAAPLVPENDPTTLFTSSGMQPLIPYLLGQTHPEGKRLVDSQPSFRAEDIDEVGDNRHTTFFEMLGNWSLGDYFKEDQIHYVFQLLVTEFGLDPSKLFATIFKGDKNLPKDTESEMLLKKEYNQLSSYFKDIREITVNENPENGIKDTDRIFYYGVEKNWWSRSGTPEKMPVGEIGGPDCEIFYDFGKDRKFHENSLYKDKPCHPNCDCGRFLEIGNSVFIQYQKQEDCGFLELKQKNVDFGGGLERLLAAANNEPDVFKTDLFWPIISQLEEGLGIKYAVDNEITKSLRIITDHLKASVFLIADGVIPSNKLQGYVVRRLLRRAATKTFSIKPGFDSQDFKSLVDTIFKIYPNYFKEAVQERIQKEISDEIRKFRNTIEKGFKEVEKIEKIDGKKAFDLYQTFGFPLEITTELFLEKGQEINQEEFKQEFEKHKELSRTASAGMFKGGLADRNEETTKLHTATHLLHQSLRTVLGNHVSQKGSNITSERLRFDFSHPEKLTPEQIKKVEDLVNDVIEKDLPVTVETMDKNEALKMGALAFFAERYPDKVTVYSIGDFSKEICGGPHVSSTGELKHFKIIKEESAGSGVRRVYASVG